MDEAPGIGIAHIDMAAVAAARGKVPALEHARPFRVVGP
jgi:predicted amidohydrolase